MTSFNIRQIRIFGGIFSRVPPCYFYIFLKRSVETEQNTKTFSGEKFPNIFTECLLFSP